jgi:serine/threonine-protein kinase
MDGQRGEELLGTVLHDSYRITRLIGAGGMGSVYEGLQLRLGKRVAVKIMARELAANDEALARFHREAEITSQLGHPHIVNVFDFGVAPSGEPYLVMEYLEGEDLEHRIRRAGRLPLLPSLHIVRQVTSALTATHENGIVHRDLKPANIFLLRVAGEDDFAKVVDFGISKAKAAATQLTRATAIMGTPHYMSPEQATGKMAEVDHRTDQWALACIVYEMLEGRPPFIGEDVGIILYQVVHEDVPAMEATTDLPAEVEQVLRQALSKRRDERFVSIGAFAAALDNAAAPFYADMEHTPGPVLTSRYKESLQYRTPTPVLVSTQPMLEQAPASTAQPTTFTRANGEMVVPMTGIAGWGKRSWMAAAVVSAVLLVGGLMFARTGSAPAKPPTPVPAAAPMSAPVEKHVVTPAPVAVPPAAPPPVPPVPPVLVAPAAAEPDTTGTDARDRDHRRRTAKAPASAVAKDKSKDKSFEPRLEIKAPAAPAKPRSKSSDEIGF